MRALSIAWKDFRHVYRNVAGLAMMLVAPLALAFALGAAFGGASGFSIAATKTVVVNADAGAGAGAPAAGATIVSALSSPDIAGLLTISTVDTAAAARAAVDSGEAGVAVIIPEGLSAALMGGGSGSSAVTVEVYKDPALTIGPAIAQAVVDSVVQSLNGARATAAAAAQLGVSAGITDTQAITELATKAAQAFAAAANEQPPITLEQRSPQVVGAQTREPNVGSQVLVGMMTFFMLFGASVPARSILDEHREGTLSRLFTTPTPRGTILAGKYIAVFLVVLLQAVILLVAGRLFMGAHWGPIAPVVVMTLCTALVAASLGLFCVSFAKTPAQAGAVSSAIFVFLGLVSGNFFGGVNVTGTLAVVRRVSPLGWLIEGWGNLLYGGSWRNIWLPVLASLAFALVFFAFATFFFQAQVRMRRVFDLAAKELLQNRRDKLAALFTIIVPVIFTVFLGILIGGASTSGLPLAVADLDGGPVAQQLLDRLGQSAAIELQTMTAADMESAVQNQKVAAAVIIPEGFNAAVASGSGAKVTLIRVETTSGAQTVTSALQAAIADLNAGILAANIAAGQVAAATGKPVDDALLSAAKSAAEAQLSAPVVTVELVKGGTGVQTADGFNQSSTGSLVNWVLFSLLSITTAMVFERRRGLLRRLSTAGVRGREIVGGKMLAMVVVTLLQQVLLILLGQFAFGVGYFNSPLALLLIMVSLSVFAASFGLLISVAFRSEQAVITTTVISAQLLAALGGAWFPLEITSPTFTKVAHFLPSAWLMDSLHGIVLKDWGVSQVLYPMAIVWIWIVVLFGLAVWRYRPE